MIEQQKQQVVECLLDATDCEMSVCDVTPTTLLREDLGLDSLAALEIAMRVEEMFDVTLTNDEAAALETVGEILALIESKRRNTAI